MAWEAFISLDSGLIHVAPSAGKGEPTEPHEFSKECPCDPIWVEEGMGYFKHRPLSEDEDDGTGDERYVQTG